MIFLQRINKNIDFLALVIEQEAQVRVGVVVIFSFGVSELDELNKLQVLVLQKNQVLLQIFGIALGETSSGQFVTSFAIEADFEAVGAAWQLAVALDFLDSATVAGLGDSGVAVLGVFDELWGHYWCVFLSAGDLQMDRIIFEWSGLDQIGMRSKDETIKSSVNVNQQK